MGSSVQRNTFLWHNGKRWKKRSLISIFCVLFGEMGAEYNRWETKGELHSRGFSRTIPFSLLDPIWRNREEERDARNWRTSSLHWRSSLRCRRRRSRRRKGFEWNPQINSISIFFLFFCFHHNFRPISTPRSPQTLPGFLLILPFPFPIVHFANIDSIYDCECDKDFTYFAVCLFPVSNIIAARISPYPSSSSGKLRPIEQSIWW